MAKSVAGGWVLGVLQHTYQEERSRHIGTIENGWGESHVGFVNRVFKTKAEAAAFYDTAFPHMRGLNAHGTWRGDWDPSTHLRFYVAPFLFQACLLNDELRWATPVPAGPLNAIYGEPRYGPIESLDVVEALVWQCECADAHSSAFHHLIPAWRDGRLFGLTIHETDQLYRSSTEWRPAVELYNKRGTFAGFWQLPCFIIVSAARDNIELVWVAPQLRRKGLGRRLVQHSGVARVEHALRSAVGFWEKMGIVPESTNS
jgi:GNAT superfamily N-acetyltransferase